MRYTFLTAIVVLLFTACGKNKYGNSPQITFLSLKPKVLASNNIPTITFRVTDGNGDLGFNAGADSAKIFLKNVLTGKTDSVLFPNIGTSGKVNMKADVDVPITNEIEKPKFLNTGHTDLVYVEIYVKDFAKNKSNVITTSEPYSFTY